MKIIDGYTVFKIKGLRRFLAQRDGKLVAILSQDHQGIWHANNSGKLPLKTKLAITDWIVSQHSFTPHPPLNVTKVTRETLTNPPTILPPNLVTYLQSLYSEADTPLLGLQTVREELLNIYQN